MTTRWPVHPVPAPGEALSSCRLEIYEGAPGYYYGWLQDPPAPREPSPAIQSMDARTWQALTTGGVESPRRHVHAGMWFRLLRTLIDELGATLKESGHRLTRQVWEHAGHPPRAGQLVWHPYEALPLKVQLQSLEAAATAIDLLENATLTGQGRQAALLLPEPEVAIDSGRRRLKMADLAGSPRKIRGKRPWSTSTMWSIMQGSIPTLLVSFSIFSPTTDATTKSTSNKSGTISPSSGSLPHSCHVSCSWRGLCDVE